MHGMWAARSLAVKINGATGVLARPSMPKPGADARRSTGSCANRLQVVRSSFHQRRSGARLNLSCLAESAANLRTSWVSSAQRELASKLHLKQRSVSPQWRQYATLFGSDGGSFVGSSGFCATALSSPRLQFLLLWMR